MSQFEEQADLIDEAKMIENLKRALAAAQEIARKDAEIAELKGHAEAMATALREIAISFDRYAGLDGNDAGCRERVNGMINAYRAACPKETP